MGRLSIVLPRGYQLGHSPLAAWCCAHFPGSWSSRHLGSLIGTDYMCRPGTTPGGQGKPGSHLYSLSEHPRSEKQAEMTLERTLI